MKELTGSSGIRLTPYDLLYAAAFLLFLFTPLSQGDDNWFLLTYDLYYPGDMTGFLSYRLETWSTRLALEALTVFLLHVPVIFRLALPLWLVLLGRGMERLAGGFTRRQQAALCIALFLLPLDMYHRIGYVCSSINYLMAMACVVWAFVPVLDMLRDIRVHRLQMILSPFLMLLGCNMEYYCPPALLAALILSLLMIRRRKKPVMPLMLAALALAGGLFAASAPTNTAAAYADSGQVYAGFDTLGPLGRLAAGLTTAAGAVNSTYHNSSLAFLAGALTVGVLLAWRGQKEGGLWRFVFLLPLGITLLTGAAARLTPEGSLWRRLFLDGDGGWLWSSPAATALAVLYFAALLCAFWRIGKFLGVFTAICLFCRCTMGFSASMTVSGLRTLFPLMAAVALACPLLMGDENEKFPWIALCCGAAAAIVLDIICLLT